MLVTPATEAQPDARPGLALYEWVRVGVSMCLFQPDTRATAVLNATAAAIADALVSGLDQTSIVAELTASGSASPTDARAWVEGVARQLDAAGFFNANQPRAPHRTKQEPVARSTWWHGRYRAESGDAFELVCEDMSLAALLAAALSPLSADDAVPVAGRILVAGHTPSLSVWRQGVRIATSLDLADARRVAIQALSMALLPVEHVAALLHASAVAIGDRAAVLGGSTGSGKTTLTMTLVADGARYLADDLTPLGRSGQAVSAFPTAASVKSGSWEAVGHRHPRLWHSPIHTVGARRVRYVDPRPSACASPLPRGNASVRVGAIVFPRYSPGSELRLTAIPAEDALSRLVAAGGEIVGAPRSIRPLAHLADSVPAYELAHSDAGQAATAIRQLMADR